MAEQHVVGPGQNRTGASLRSWLALTAAAVSSFTTTLDVQMTTFSLGPLADAFGVDSSLIAWVAVMSLLFMVGLMLTAGALSDRFGRERVLIIGLVLTTLSLAASAIAQDFPQLLATRALHGFGNVLVVAPGVALIVGAMPPSHRGIALGVQGMAAGVGYFAGPALAGLLLEHFDWRALFYMRIPIHLAALALAVVYLRARDRGARAPLDPAGVALSIAAFVSLTLAINQGARLGWTHPLPLSAAVAAPVFGLALVYVERLARAPVFDLGLLVRVRSYWVGIMSHFLTYHIQTGIPILSAVLVLSKRDGGLAEAGLIVAIYPLARVILSPFSGWLSDRIGVQVMIVTGLAVLSTATLALGVWAADAPLGLTAALFFVAGLGFVMWEPANQSAIVQALPDQVGVASSALALARNLGIASGVTVATAAFVLAASAAAGLPAEVARPSSLGTEAVGHGVEVAFRVIAAFGFAGLAVSLLRSGRWPLRR